LIEANDLTQLQTAGGGRLNCRQHRIAAELSVSSEASNRQRSLARHGARVECQGMPATGAFSGWGES